MPVVDDLKELESPVLDSNTNACRPSIQSVLQELLDRVRRPVDDLQSVRVWWQVDANLGGGDAIDNVGCELLDGSRSLRSGRLGGGRLSAHAGRYATERLDC